MVALRGHLHCHACGQGGAQLGSHTAGDVQSAPQEVERRVASVELHGLFGE